MEDEDEGFELWQYLAGVRVDNNGDGHYTPVHQCTLPQCWTVARVIQLGQG